MDKMDKLQINASSLHCYNMVVLCLKMWVCGEISCIFHSSLLKLFLFLFCFGFYSTGFSLLTSPFDLNRGFNTKPHGVTRDAWTQRGEMTSSHEVQSISVNFLLGGTTIRLEVDDRTKKITRQVNAFLVLHEDRQKKGNPHSPLSFYQSLLCDHLMLTFVYNLMFCVCVGACVRWGGGVDGVKKKRLVCVFVRECFWIDPTESHLW